MNNLRVLSEYLVLVNLVKIKEPYIFEIPVLTFAYKDHKSPLKGITIRLIVNAMVGPKLTIM